MQYLMPAVANSSHWDVLVGHYLGVDHAGHSGDVWSADMDAKLSQMDGQMEQVHPSLSLVWIHLVPFEFVLLPDRRSCLTLHMSTSRRHHKAVLFNLTSLHLLSLVF